MELWVVRNYISRISLVGLPKSVLLIVMAGAMIVFVALSLISQVWDSENNISSIKIEGNSLVPDSVYIKSIAPLAIGLSKSSIDLVKINNVLEAIPYISKSTPIFDGPEILKVKISEKQPMAYFLDTRGDLKYATTCGKVIPAVKKDKMPGMPLITGIKQPGGKDTTALKNAVEILMAVMKQYPETANIISELNYEADPDSFTIYTTVANLKVLFGRNDKIDSKMKKLMKFIESDLMIENYENIGYLDLRWSNQLIVGK